MRADGILHCHDILIGPYFETAKLAGGEPCILRDIVVEINKLIDFLVNCICYVSSVILYCSILYLLDFADGRKLNERLTLALYSVISSLGPPFSIVCVSGSWFYFSHTINLCIIF
jgi:hypothetical protein